MSDVVDVKIDRMLADKVLEVASLRKPYKKYKKYSKAIHEALDFYIQSKGPKDIVELDKKNIEQKSDQEGH